MLCKKLKTRQEIVLDTSLQEMLEIVSSRPIEEKLEIIKKMGFTKDTQPKPWHGIKMTTPFS